MKVVIDTNVVVSAVLKPGRNPEAVIRYIAQRADTEWIVSSEILAGYKEVLSRKKFVYLRSHYW